MRISWTSLFAALLFLGSLRAEGLAFKWRTEVSSAAPYDAQAMQGESFTLEATLVQYGQPMAGEATATFYYQTKDMEKHQWYTAPAAWASATGTVSATWTPAMDVGTTAYRWFFGVDTAEGKNYRVFGTLRLKASPGFSPAILQPTDIRETLKAELYAQLQADLSAAFAADLQAEAQAREEADSAITQAVNAQAGVLEQHQGYLSTLSGNFNALYSSYTNTVSELQATDAAHESALAAKADAAALTNHAATWATGTVGGHVKLGTNSILSTADGNFGVVGKTSNNQLIYRLDATPTQNSSLPVKSGGVYTALAAKAALEHTHSQYLTTESDPTVSAWAKAATKPTYTAAEVGAQPAGKYVTYDTTSHSLDAVSKETSFAGGIRTDSFKTLYGTPFFNTVSDRGFNITGFYRLNGYRTENNPLLEWDVSTQKSKLAVTTVYEGGTSLSQKYAPISHTHTVSAITDFPTTWDWAKLTNKPTAFTPAAHNHDGTYLKLSGGTVTGNVTLNGTGNYVNNLIFGGTAAEAGLKVRGIWGKPTGNTNQKAELYLNLPLQSEGDVGTDAYFSTPQYGVYIRGGWGSDAINYLALRRIDGDTFYAPKTHSHAIADTTGLQAALEALAPLSSVTCTTNNVTYIWQWDEAAGTFALVER